MINKRYWKDEEILPKVVEVIFQKCIEDQNRIGIIVDLCHTIHKAEQIIEKDNFKRCFHVGLIQKCQFSFETTVFSQFTEYINKLQCEIIKEQNKEKQDERKLATLDKDIQYMKDKEKQRMLGTVKFVAYLFKVGLLNYKIVENCVVILIRNAEEGGDELMIEYAITLMKCVGPFVGQKLKDICIIDGYVSYLEKFKGHMSDRIKFMIIDLEELKERKWKIAAEANISAK